MIVYCFYLTFVLPGFCPDAGSNNNTTTPDVVVESSETQRNRGDSYPSYNGRGGEGSYPGNKGTYK